MAKWNLLTSYKWDGLNCTYIPLLTVLLCTFFQKGERDRLATRVQDLEKDLHAETTSKQSLEGELKEEKQVGQQIKVCIQYMHKCT